MIYFFINLCLHFLISVGLLLALLRFVSNNQKHRNRRGISYLLPVVITVIFLFQSLYVTAPRLLDCVYVLKQNYETISGKVESVGYLNHALVIDGEKYYYNPFIFKPQAGDILEISFTPYAHYVSELKLAQP
ncbi:MAG: hypothetical protein WCG21_08630 [Eubacteriales bacterium]